MNKETLINERNSCKRKVVTFSVLTGVSLLFMIITVVVFLLVSVYLGINSETQQIFTERMLVAMAGYIFFMITFALAASAFTPFLIINAVKLGKRNRLLKKMDNYNG